VALQGGDDVDGTRGPSFPAGFEPKTPRAEAKRKRVMEAAAKLIALRGYHETSMRDIAAELGMSAASLYHYFLSKEDLVAALQRDCFEQIFHSVRGRLANLTDPVERFYAFVLNHMTVFVDNIALIRVLLHEDVGLSKINREEIRKYKKEYIALCEDLVRSLPRDEGAPALDPRTVVFSLFGMMNWFYTWQHTAPDVKGADLAHDMAQVFLRGYQSQKVAVPELVW
jgi:AcrR family transcriptional regulator